MALHTLWSPIGDRAASFFPLLYTYPRSVNTPRCPQAAQKRELDKGQHTQCSEPRAARRETSRCDHPRQQRRLAGEKEQCPLCPAKEENQERQVEQCARRFNPNLRRSTSAGP